MKQSTTASNQITDGVIWKQLLVFFFPILLGSFFQQLYNTVDAVIVGKFVGKEALAAVGGPTSTLINLLVGFFVGLSSGATVIISQFYGAQKPEETSRAVHTAMALALAGGVVMTIVGVGISPWALSAMGTPSDIMDYALTYIRVYFSGIIFSLIYNVGAGILRAVGDSRRPLYFLIACSMTNVVLDLLLVVMLNLGVLGAAIATFLSQALSAGLVLLSLTKTPQIYQLNLRRVRFTLPILKNIIKIGLPAGLQSVMYSASNIIIQSTINSFGTDTVAAWTAYGKIDGIFWMITGAYGISITTFAGQNFGAQRYSRMHKSVLVCSGMSFATAVAMSVVIMLAGPYIYLLFTNDPQVIQLGLSLMKVMVPFYFTFILVEVLSGALRGAGDAVIPMIMTCFGVCVLRIVWILVAVPVHRTPQVLAMSYPITWATTSLLFLVYYLQGGWLKRCVAKAGFPPLDRPFRKVISSR